MMNAGIFTRWSIFIGDFLLQINETQLTSVTHAEKIIYGSAICSKHRFFVSLNVTVYVLLSLNGNTKPHLYLMNIILHKK